MAQNMFCCIWQLFFFLAIGFIWILPSYEASADLSDEKRLINYLVNYYEKVGKVGRPIHTTSDTTQVQFGLALIQIFDLNAATGVLDTLMWQRFLWNDEFLKWNSSDFGDIKQVRIPIESIWSPDVVLYNGVEPPIKMFDALAVVSSDGTVLYIPATRLKSSCSMDLTDYPRDTQQCSLKFSSWTYDGFKIDVDFYNGLAQVDVSDYIVSNTWELLEHSAKRNVKHYPCCEEPYIDLNFTIKVKRIRVINSVSIMESSLGQVGLSIVLLIVSKL